MPIGRDRVTIVGASLAGYWAAETLRRDGFKGVVSLIGDELHVPYDRPPLSKKYLAGGVERHRLDLSDTEKLAALDLEMRLGQRATGLDLSACLLYTSAAADATP